MKRKVFAILSLGIGLIAVLIGVNSASALYPAHSTTTQNSKLKTQNLPNPGDWPMYGHDVSHTSHNPDETTLSADNVNQLVQRWQANIGNGNTPSSSSPSVAGGKVFVASSAQTGNNFFAYAAVEGGRLWGANIHYFNCLGVGIGSTSAVSGTIVAVGGGDQAYYGLDTETGDVIWRNPMNVGSSAFTWASPMFAYDRAYLGMSSCAGNPTIRSEVRAVNMYNGTPVANQYLVPEGQRGADIWNSPALSPDGSVLAVTTGEDTNFNGPYTRAMVALDPITLEILGANQQGVPNADQDFGTSPIMFHDSAGRALVGANHKNGVFYAYLLHDVSAGPLWQKATGTRPGMMPAYDPTFGDGGTVFIVGGTRIYAVDPATGNDRWPAVTVGTLQGNMAIANGLIFANTGSSGLRILNVSNGSILRTIVPAPAGTAYTGPAVSNGFVYWVAGAYLNAWSLPGTPGPTNTPADTPTPAPATHTPTIAPTFAPTDTPTGLPTATNTPTSPPLTSTTAPTYTPTVVSSQSPVASSTRTPTPTPCSIGFSDVQPSDYFYTSVTYLACHGVISGYSDGTFRPYNSTTRGQLSKIVVLAEGWVVNCPTVPTFTDVDSTNPFYCHIETAYDRGVISGYSDGTFRPGNNVTRAQICKIIVLAEGWAQQCPATPHFTDVSSTDPFYCFIETAHNRGIISGYSDGTFRPGNNATRGQICKIVYQAITAP